MSVSGSRGLISISRNPLCDLQTAMVIAKTELRVSEKAFHRAVAGQEMEIEYGERVSAARRGKMYEERLYQNNAELLRRAVGQMYGHDPERMTVRDISAKSSTGVAPKAPERWAATREILRAAAEGRPRPDLVIQPQFKLPLDDGKLGMPISPDFMIFDREAGVYVPGEAKSQILREGVGDAADLGRARLQAAVQIRAYVSDIAALGLVWPIINRAVFVFATPYGLAPADPVEERNLDAEAYEIERAIRRYLELRARPEPFLTRTDDGISVAVDRLPINYEEGCVGACPMAGYCRGCVQSDARVLGDDVAALFGPETKIERLFELLDGAVPETEQEELLAARITEVASVYGEIEGGIRRRA